MRDSRPAQHLVFLCQQVKFISKTSRRAQLPRVSGQLNALPAAKYTSTVT